MTSAAPARRCRRPSPPTRLGVGGGVDNALRQMGGAIGAALTLAIVGRGGQAGVCTGLMR